MTPTTDALARLAIAEYQDAVHLERCEQWRGLHEFLNEKHLKQTIQSARFTHPEACKVWSEGNGAGFVYISVVRMYAERLSVAFDQAPQTYLRRAGTTERLPESDPQVVQWRKDARHVEFAQTMQQVEETVTALGQAAVSPTWARDRIRWRVHAPHELAVVKSDIDPDSFEAAKAIAIQIRTKDGGTAQCDWLVWTFDGTSWGSALYDHGGRFKSSPVFMDGANGYDRHPAVLWQWRKPTSGEVFIDPDEPLLQLARRVNVHTTDLGHGMTHQVHAQPVVWGNPEGIQDGAVITGPDVMVKFTGRRESGDFEFRTPVLNIAELRATINYMLTTFAVARGLPPDVFQPDSSTRNLGAKLQETAELDRLRKKRYPVIMDAMRETFEVHKAVGNYWARHGAKRTEYAEDIELEVELQPIARVEDRQAKTQADAIAIERGQTSTAAIVQQETGVTREEALATVARNLADEQAAHGVEHAKEPAAAPTFGRTGEEPGHGP